MSPGSAAFANACLGVNPSTSNRAIAALSFAPSCTSMLTDVAAEILESGPAAAVSNEKSASTRRRPSTSSFESRFLIGPSRKGATATPRTSNKPAQCAPSEIVSEDRRECGYRPSALPSVPKPTRHRRGSVVRLYRGQCVPRWKFKTTQTPDIGARTWRRESAHKAIETSTGQFVESIRGVQTSVRVNWPNRRSNTVEPAWIHKTHRAIVHVRISIPSLRAGNTIDKRIRTDEAADQLVIF